MLILLCIAKLLKKESETVANFTLGIKICLLERMKVQLVNTLKMFRGQIVIRSAKPLPKVVRTYCDHIQHKCNSGVTQLSLLLQKSARTTVKLYSSAGFYLHA